MNRRSFLQSVAAALAYAFVPVGLRRPAPQVDAEPSRVAELAESTAQHWQGLADGLRWLACPAAESIKAGQAVFLSDKGGLTYCPGVAAAPIGVAMRDAAKGGSVYVVLRGWC